MGCFLANGYIFYIKFKYLSIYDGGKKVDASGLRGTVESEIYWNGFFS